MSKKYNKILVSILKDKVYETRRYALNYCKMYKNSMASWPMLTDRYKSEALKQIIFYQFLKRELFRECGSSTE